MAGSRYNPVNRTADNSDKHIDQLERDLQATLERYELIWKATHDVLYDLDIPAGTIVWNEELYAQFGYNRREPTGTLEWWVAHIHPDDATYVAQSFHNWIVGTSETSRTEYRFLRANGLYSYVLDRGFVIRDAQGSPLRIIGTLFDISQEKELERAKDEFISLVSHQLRTPLTVIRIYGEMFASGLLGSLTDTQSAHVSRMTSASIRLIKLVDDIMQISRLELNKYNVVRDWIDIRQVISEALRDIEPIASEKNTVITFEAAPTEQKILTDAGIVRQILDNLLSNAIRYTDGKSGYVTVTCGQRGSELVIAISDNGIGIPKTAQKYVFDRFYRAHNAINIEEHGTGLGLYLVSILVKLMAGRVWFKSQMNKGTTFYVALPIG